LRSGAARKSGKVAAKGAWKFMLQTIEVEIDVNGTVRLLTPVKVTKTTRAVLTLLDDTSPSHILPPEITAPEERAQAIEEIVKSM
jgi:hypothetical protein